MSLLASSRCPIPAGVPREPGISNDSSPLIASLGLGPDWSTPSAPSMVDEAGVYLQPCRVDRYTPVYYR